MGSVSQPRISDPFRCEEYKSIKAAQFATRNSNFNLETSSDKDLPLVKHKKKRLNLRSPVKSTNMTKQQIDDLALYSHISTCKKCARNHFLNIELGSPNLVNLPQVKKFIQQPDYLLNQSRSPRKELVCSATQRLKQVQDSKFKLVNKSNLNSPEESRFQTSRELRNQSVAKTRVSVKNDGK